MTISSRTPFFGESGQDATVPSDVVVQSDVPELIVDLPTEPIALSGDPQLVRPLSTEVDQGEAPDVVLRRGPASPDADAPIMFVITDAESDAPTGARLVIVGMSIGWLPEDVADTLVRNLADWMLEDK
jgi:hypothetical protein